MAIVYIHGVGVRSPEHGKELAKSFNRWLAPKIGLGGNAPLYVPVYWGDIASRFRWKLKSRPPTQLLAMGGAGPFDGLGSLRAASANAPFDRRSEELVPSVTGPVLDRPAGGALSTAKPAPPLSSVPLEQRADLLADLYLISKPKRSPEVIDPLVEDPQFAALADVAANVATRWQSIIQAFPTEEEQIAGLMQAMDRELSGQSTLITQGGFADWMTNAGERLKRAANWPGDAISTVFAELRPAINDAVANFLGDVMVYLTTRDAHPGPNAILRRVLDALIAAHERKSQVGERIVVITHSMGGQLFYDAVAHYAALEPKLSDLQVDEWVTCGSQVSLFAELGLFKQQPSTEAPQKLPLPPHVVHWTNYYDQNDFLGFAMQEVFENVTDVAYDTGYGLAFAHSGFFARPSFFEKISSNL